MIYHRRTPAAAYLKSKYGHGSKRTLDKLAVIGGGPEMISTGRIPLYTEEALDRWALSLLSQPVANTAQRPAKAGAKTTQLGEAAKARTPLVEEAR